jgi:hypothetical protein
MGATAGEHVVENVAGGAQGGGAAEFLSVGLSRQRLPDQLKSVRVGWGLPSWRPFFIWDNEVGVLPPNEIRKRRAVKITATPTKMQHCAMN